MDVLENAVIEKNALVEAEAFPTDDRVTYKDSTYEIISPTAYHIQRRISSREGALSGEQELDHAQLRDTIGAADFKRK